MAFDPNPLIDRLCEAFPAGFNRDAPKPLKIGISRDLLALVGVHPALADVSRIQVRRTLTVYVRRFVYRKALMAGGPRYDLEGQPSGEVTPEQQAFATDPRQQKSQARTASTASRAVTVLVNLTELLPELIAMAIPGKLDVTLKINELPKAKPTSPGTMLFAVQADGRTVLVELKNKAWNNLKTASENYSQWVAAITGKMGETMASGFRLENPAVQVFEKKSKPEAITTPAEPPTSVPSPVIAEPTPKIERPKLGLKGRSGPAS